MSGNGDPMASSIMRPLLHRFRPSTTQTIRLYTNGLLLEKQLTDNPICRAIKEYFISVDAGSAAVYEQVRLGGRWTTLQQNLEFLYWTSTRYSARVLLLFVLQRDNYDDLENFVRLCVRYGFNGWINRLENWGTYGFKGRDFSQHDVIGNADHPLHAEALASLRDVYARYQGHQIRFESSLQQLAKGNIPTV
jgi:MoaA/NifB/PqqE/SkfB family radical SAM enzyme